MKLTIDIPDNELKDPLKNIHLLISNGIVTEVCIKKYDKNKNPYFMNLNYISLEECGDCVSRQAAINAAIEAVADYTGYYSSLCEEYIRKALEILPPVTPTEKVGHWIKLDNCSNSGYYCSKCQKKVVKEGWSDTVKTIKYCPNCGAKMEGKE